MNYNLDIEKFKQYFHYGLEYEQEEILDAIIISGSKIVNKMNLETIDNDMNRLEYTIDMIKNLYVQFERFINLTSDNSEQWYKKIDKESVSDIVMQRLEYLKNRDLISVVEYEPMCGIYTTDRVGTMDDTRDTGIQRYENIQDWVKDGIIPNLVYLSHLEKENPYQYNSLFLDTKYARSMNCNNRINMQKIKFVYALFMESVKPAKEDVYNTLGNNITVEDRKYIEKNCADYWTITDLKEQAKSDKYIDKVHNQCEYIKLQNSKDRSDD